LNSLLFLSKGTKNMCTRVSHPPKTTNDEQRKICPKVSLQGETLDHFATMGLG